MYSNSAVGKFNLLITFYLRMYMLCNIKIISKLFGRFKNFTYLCIIVKQLKLKGMKKEQNLQEPHKQALNIPVVRQRIIDYTNWLTKQNLMICEGVDGYTFRSSMIGGKKYTAEELYDKFVSEYVA